MVMVVRAWVENGREPGFRARLLQAELPGAVPPGPDHVVTTSIDQTVEAIRAWLEVLDEEARESHRDDAGR
jgi:hypothetical protein